MEKNNNYFTVEATPNQTLMKEGYRVVVYRSWRGIVNIGLAVLCLGTAAYKAYDAWHWTRIGWEDAWEHNLSYIVYFLLIGGFVLGRLIAAPELGARKYMRRLTAVHGDCSTLHISYFLPMMSSVAIVVQGKRQRQHTIRLFPCMKQQAVSCYAERWVCLK